MNDFYDISDKDEIPHGSMQLINLGEQRVYRFSSSGVAKHRHATQRIYKIRPEDYDNLFAYRISRTRPPYAIDKFLDHHFQYYLTRFPGETKTFFKHLKYVIIPILQKREHTLYIELVEEWMNEKKIIAPAKPEMTINEKLDKILTFLVANAIRNNINPHTIHEEIFEKAITLKEAQELHRKLLTSGKVRVIGHAYLAHSIDTTTFLQQGGFSGSINALLESSVINQTPNITMSNSTNPSEQEEVFISYSWDNKEHEEKVGAFTNFLLQNGFDAKIDKMISQLETATNFTTMMHKAIAQHQKIIVVLSAGYKKKAEEFIGGVGEEYQILINDIKQRPRKYILVSFNGRSSDIVPLGLQGRDIIDLSLPGGKESLFLKLMDQDEYVFSKVAPQKPILKQKQFGDFKACTSHALSIEEPMVKIGNTSSFSRLYKSIEFTLTPVFKNTTPETLDGFAYNVKVKRELAPENYNQSLPDGVIEFQEEVKKKIFPSQGVNGVPLNLKIQAHNIRLVLGTTISITVFTESGPISETFAIEKLLKVPPATEPYKEKRPLQLDMFFTDGR